MMLDYVL